MLLVGTEEPFAEHAREAANLLPRGNFVPLNGLDHVQTFFRSDLVVPLVRVFLSQTNARRLRALSDIVRRLKAH
jgi:hypothetical protein